MIQDSELWTEDECAQLRILANACRRFRAEARVSDFLLTIEPVTDALEGHAKAAFDEVTGYAFHEWLALYDAWVALTDELAKEKPHGGEELVRGYAQAQDMFAARMEERIVDCIVTDIDWVALSDLEVDLGIGTVPTGEEVRQATQELLQAARRIEEKRGALLEDFTEEQAQQALRELAQEGVLKAAADAALVVQRAVRHAAKERE